jgi:glutaredoxin-related protein
MIKIFGMEQCPHCRRCKGEFDARGIAYEFVDISQLENLKKFVKLRDTQPTFEGIHGTESVGIPALVFDDGSVRRDWQAYLSEGSDDVDIPDAAEGAACSLDGTGC